VEVVTFIVMVRYHILPLPSVGRPNNHDIERVAAEVAVKTFVHSCDNLKVAPWKNQSYYIFMLFPYSSKSIAPSFMRLYNQKSV